MNCILENKPDLYPVQEKVDKIFTLVEFQKGSREFEFPIHVLFVALEKGYDRVPRDILLNNAGVLGTMVGVKDYQVKGLNPWHKMKSKFLVQVGQDYPLSQILLAVLMERISMDSRKEEGDCSGKHVVLLASSC